MSCIATASRELNYENDILIFQLLLLCAATVIAAENIGLTQTDEDSVDQNCDPKSPATSPLATKSINDELPLE